MKVKKFLKYVESGYGTQVCIFSKDETGEINKYYNGEWNKVPYNLLDKKIVSIRSC